MAGCGYDLLEEKFDFSRMGPQDKYDLANACCAYIKMIAPLPWWGPWIGLFWFAVTVGLIYWAEQYGEKRGRQRQNGGH